ncbi:MAG: hypothetical protein CMD04_05580 [Flavobacteriales bacterium]|nr:hypothetical protein [Flavobacteriales bacterium]
MVQKILIMNKNIFNKIIIFLAINIFSINVFAQDFDYIKFLIQQQLHEKDNNGFINSSILIESTPTYKAIVNDIQYFAMALDNQLTAMENEYEQLVNDYKINENSYSDLVKTDKIQEIEAFEIRITAFEENAIIALNEKEEELLDPLISMIYRAIEHVGIEKKYSYIFDTYGDSLEILFENINDNSEINYSKWQGNGTGFFISKSGYIATNNHVIDGASELAIEFKYKNEIKEFKVKVIKVDKINDLAIIKINDSKFYSLDLIPYNFKSKSVDVGTDVFALGYPKALTIMGKEIKFTDGRISSKTGFKGDITTYQSTTPIQPGNSGGPLFDFNGNLIGINNAKIITEDVEGVSYSIKASYLLNLIDVLPEEINLPSSNKLASKPLTEQIKVLSNYVVLIKRK